MGAKVSQRAGAAIIAVAAALVLSAPSAWALSKAELATEAAQGLYRLGQRATEGIEHLLPNHAAGQAAENVAGKAAREAVDLPVVGGDSSVLKAAIKLTTPGWQAHHIIPVEASKVGTEKTAHRVLRKIGLYFDNAENGIALPSKEGLDPFLPVHNGYHKAYSDAVIGYLDAIPENLSVEATRNAMTALQRALRTCIECGESSLYFKPYVCPAAKAVIEGLQ